MLVNWKCVWNVQGWCEKMLNAKSNNSVCSLKGKTCTKGRPSALTTSTEGAIQRKPRLVANLLIATILTIEILGVAGGAEESHLDNKPAARPSRTNKRGMARLSSAA